MATAVRGAPPAMRPWRIVFVFAAIVLCTLGLSGRLVYWQVLESGQLQERLTNQHTLDEIVPARRGTIRDAKGDLLAGNQSMDYIYAEPARIKQPETVAAKLAPILSTPAEPVTPEQLLPALTDPNRRVVPLLSRRKFASDVTEQVAQLRVTGIFLEPATARIYPDAHLAAHVLGFVDADGEGRYGIEGQYADLLAGKPGRLQAEKDTAGNEIAFGDRQWMPPEDGLDVHLTIDRTIQYIAERELERAVVQHRASGGTVIVMEPRRGAIRAMASRPAFDPNRYTEFAAQPEVFANPAVTFLFEPGSTFKLVTIAGALNEHVVTPQTTYQDSGALAIGGYVIRNWDGKANGLSNMVTLLEKSSNIGASWVAFQTGKERFYRYVNLFGFGQATGIDLQGEAQGIVKNPAARDWSDVDLATNSFGQAISVSPIQMVSAVAAIANGGIMMKPYVVQKVVDPRTGDPRTGRLVRNAEPQIVRQVISRDTASTLLQMMVNAAENEGVRGQLVPGYYVAGKTGTASIPVAGGYDPTQTIASFVGVVPASDPQFVVLVKIDRPQDEPWGSLIAKPAFALIAQELTRYLKVPAEYRATSGLGVPTPSPTPVPTPRRPLATPTRPAAQAPSNPPAARVAGR